MSLLDPVRRLFRPAPAAEPEARRSFFRRMGGASLLALGGGALMTDEAWAATEAGARAAGITPGTLVDAQGRPLGRPVMGSDAFLGEIMMTGFNFPPVGWAKCDGQTLSIQQNTALYSLLGTNFGGDGQTTYKLPDLRGRFPMHLGGGPGLSSRVIGETGGSETTTMTVAQMPAHTHGVSVASTAGTTPDPTNGILAAPASSIPQYAPAANATGSLAGVGQAGSGQAMTNMPPFLAINFCIALQGIYPSRN